MNEKAAQVRLMIFDVDGVLTDGSVYVMENGEQARQFNVDLSAFHQALENIGIKLGIAVLPLVSKEGLPEKARDLYQALRRRLPAEFDEGAVGQRRLGEGVAGAGDADPAPGLGRRARRRPHRPPLRPRAGHHPPGPLRAVRAAHRLRRRHGATVGRRRCARAKRAYGRGLECRQRSRFPCDCRSTGSPPP